MVQKSPSVLRLLIPLLGIAVAWWALLEEPVFSSTLRPMSLDELVQKSEHIVCGEVTEMKCYRGPLLNLGEIIFTDVTVKITDRISGQLGGQTVTIQVPGGRLGDLELSCSSSPRYTQGEKVLLFLRQFNGRRWNTGWSQGKYTLLTREVGGGEEVFVRGKVGLPIAEFESLGNLVRQISSLKAKELRR